ncbi:hypothetical protein PF007_g23425, partial [Phytophthora fragariae]
MQMPRQTCEGAAAESSSEDDQAPVRVVCPGVERVWHLDWEAFETYFSEYMRATSQLYRVRSSTPPETRNKKIKAKLKWERADLIPEDCGFHYKKYECTHAGQTKPRGEGRRTGHLVRGTGCKATISATLMLKEDEGAYQVKVTRCVVVHNHAIDHNIYSNYPSQRRIEDEGVIDIVNEMRLAGSKPRLILQFLRRSTDKKIILRDVHNLVQRPKRERRTASTVEERLELVLRSFCSSEGNSATVFVDDKKTAQTIAVLSHQMHRFFEAFPQIVLLDSTHNTNASRYKLFSFMVNDVFGQV